MESMKQTSKENKQRKEDILTSKQGMKACKEASKHVIKQTNKERVSSKDKCGFGCGVCRSIRLEYGRHLCHQAKFLRRTQDFVYKDECKLARNHGYELCLMTQTSKQRHMHKHANKDARMETKAKEPNKVARSKQAKRGKACYHTRIKLIML